MDQATLEEIKTIKWWHKIDLGNGVVTPGTTDSEEKLPRLHLPEDMTGLRVLDVGCWDGWWSFLCERRGAKQVVALDTWKFDTGHRGFDLARRMLKSGVIGIQGDVHKINPDNLIGKYDLILCLGALHHFQNPLLALQNIRSLCKGTLILETHLDMEGVDFPVCMFYDECKPYSDPTILWGPNHQCVNSWLHYAGFKKVEMVDYTPKPAGWSGDRGVFHASV